MFTSNCGFFHCGQASRQAYSTHRATKSHNLQCYSAKKPKSWKIHNETGHVNRLNKCDSSTNNNGSDKLVAFLVFINCFIDQIGLFSGKTVLSKFYVKYSISH